MPLDPGLQYEPAITIAALDRILGAHLEVDTRMAERSAAITHDARGIDFDRFPHWNGRIGVGTSARHQDWLVTFCGIIALAVQGATSLPRQLLRASLCAW